MKFSRVIQIIISSILFLAIVLGGILYLIKPELIGDVFFGLKMYDYAARLYKTGYDQNLNPEILEKLGYTVNDDKEKVLYYGKLLDDDQYLLKKSKAQVDALKYNYMQALYNSGEKTKFREFYYNNIKAFDDELLVRQVMTRAILRSGTAQEDDYNFIIEESKYLYGIDEIRNSDDLLQVYTNMAESYKALGNTAQYEKFSRLRDDKRNEILSRN